MGPLERVSLAVTFLCTHAGTDKCNLGLMVTAFGHEVSHSILSCGAVPINTFDQVCN